jgi:hypothetical protein
VAGARASADFERPAAAENPVGQRTGGTAEGGGEDDGGGGGGLDDDDGGGSGTKSG